MDWKAVAIENLEWGLERDSASAGGYSQTSPEGNGYGRKPLGKAECVHSSGSGASEEG